MPPVLSIALIDSSEDIKTAETNRKKRLDCLLFLFLRKCVSTFILRHRGSQLKGNEPKLYILCISHKL